MFEVTDNVMVLQILGYISPRSGYPADLCKSAHQRQNIPNCFLWGN